jgi:uroporphyrinogen decarboxylase
MENNWVRKYFIAQSVQIGYSNFHLLFSRSANKRFQKDLLPKRGGEFEVFYGVKSMTSRERLLTALNHKTPDRVPIDLGGTPTSTISISAHENLKSHLGIRAETRVMSPIFLTAYPDDSIVERFGVDVKMVTAKPPANFKLQVSPGGRIIDEWGIVYQKHEEAQTHFVVENESPLHRVSSKGEIAKYPWPDPADPTRYTGLRDVAKGYREQGFGVVVNTPIMVMTFAQWLRGLEQFMFDTALNPGLLEYLMDKILEILLEMTRLLLEEVKPYADVLVIGDDLSHQGGLTYSPDMYRRLFKPRHRAIVQFLKKHGGEAKILYHCCGAAKSLLSELVEIGIDAYNPVQVSAVGMDDTRELKKTFGKDLTFWGGIDTQRVMPFGKPVDVRQEVKRRIEELGPDGGFVLGAVHNLRPEVTPENICALFEAALEFGRYPAKK